MQILVLGAPEYAPQMAALLDAMLQARQLGVTVVTLLESAPPDATAAPTQEAFISLRLESRDPKRWQLHLWRADRHWVRTLDGGIERDAAAVEACALIAAQAVAALLAEPTDPELTAWEPAVEPPPERDATSAVGALTTRPEGTEATTSTDATAATAAPGTTAPRTLRDRASTPGRSAAPGELAWALSLGAALSLYAPSEQVEGSGLQPSGLLELEHRLVSGWVFGAGLELALPAERTAELGSFSLERRAAQLAAGYRTELAGLSGQLGLAVVGEATQRSDTVPMESVAATPAPTHLRLALAPSLTARYALSGWTELGARATVAWFPSAQRFVSHGPDASELLVPYALRPRLDLLLSLLL